MEIHSAARKHGVESQDILHAVDHPLIISDLDEDDSPHRALVLGPDTAGNILELIVLHFDDGREMVIHAMSMRNRYRSMLPHPPEPTNMTKHNDQTVIGTSRGTPITDADIERMADEAEAGYDSTRLRPRGGRPLMGTAPAEVVPVRLDPDLRAAVEARAIADHTTTSDIIREALRRFLDVA